MLRFIVLDEPLSLPPQAANIGKAIKPVAITQVCRHIDVLLIRS
jgi:hypothetical protein